ncbi:MAG: Na+/H+ antiporter NhaC family protein [Clostridia bacterium]|nr:Na+/H+ antiporter NhaC family protein [Clostridia bacterium]
MSVKMKRWCLFLTACALAFMMCFAGFAEDAGTTEAAPVETTEVAAAEEMTEEIAVEEEAEYASSRYATWWSLLPPVIAIGLALITKEVYSSLFIGVLVGGLLYANFNPLLAFTTIVGSESGIIGKLSDGWNVGILVFLVILGIIVVLVNRAGGSAAYGTWAARRIGSKKGAGLATLGLGALIFVDDYFNCLTVGSVMRPVTDNQKMSRAKLAYIIDSTAAPVCIIAPISSWAAAVVGVVEGVDGLQLFINAIPFNFYAILTIVTVISLSAMKFDFGPMRKAEEAAERNDMAAGGALTEVVDDEKISSKGKVIDLILPVVVLIGSCIWGMIYTGGFFEGETFVNAFANCDAALGLALGSMIALLFTFIYYLVRRVIPFRDMMDSIPKGFSQMVPAIMILLLAWSLSGMTGLLGADEFVAALLDGNTTMMNLLPALVFVVALGLAFATGTSWGTFSILLPIVAEVVIGDPELLVVVTSACLAGAVCGDHCSPISDTTIMASAGAHCNHVMHVSTQLPYALTVAGVSVVMYIVAGFVQNWLICLPLGIIVMLAVLFVIRMVTKPKAA